MSKEREANYHPHITELEAASPAFESCMKKLGEPEILGWELDSGNLFWLWGEAVTSMVAHYQPLLDAKDAEIAKLTKQLDKVRAVRGKMCQKKLGHATKGKADAHLLLKHGKDSVNMHSYECPYCFMWHVGHKTASYNGKPPVALQEENTTIKAALEQAREGFWVLLEHNKLHHGENHNTVALCDENIAAINAATGKGE